MLSSILAYRRAGRVGEGRIMTTTKQSHFSSFGFNSAFTRYRHEWPMTALWDRTYSSEAFSSGLGLTHSKIVH